MIFFGGARKSIDSKLPLFALLIFITLLFSQNTAISKDVDTPHIDIVGDSIYLDGEKFFIKGIGYSPYRPGEWPGSPVSLEIVEADFKRIKEAGFNTLRVWGTMPEEQLKLAERYGLKVIQAVSLDPGADFGYIGYIRSAESKVSEMCKLSKRHPNVIMYLLMNEPHAKAVVNSGVDNTLNLYKHLIDIIRREDPHRPISMANAYWTAWLDQSMWDVVSFNAYSWSPLLVKDIGYANFIEILKSLHSAEKPFLVTEFGLSVSPEGEGDYGGNTEEEQAQGLVNSFRELLEGGAAGGCVFEWNDEWWKAGNPVIHDAHPEEWFGIIGIESSKNPIGTPRKAYYSLKEELKLVVTKPKDGYRMLDKADIEVNTSLAVTDVQYRFDDGEWMNLAKTGDWWRGTIDGSSAKPGPHKLVIKGLDGGKEIIRSLDIIKCRDENETLSPINIELTTDKPFYKNGDTMMIRARMTYRDGAPLKSCCVKMGVFNSTDTHLRRWEGSTDEDGFFSRAIPVLGNLKEWYYIYWAGAEIEDYGKKIREGKLGYVKADFGEGLPIKWLTAKKAKKIKIDGIIEKAWFGTERILIDPDTNYAEGSIDSSDDLSAEVRLLWDEDNIYLLANVNDDIPMRNKKEKIDLWNGDCIELFISVEPTRITKTGYSSSDFQILIGTNGKMWIPGQAKGGVRNDVPILSKAVAKKGNKGYILEAKINIENFQNLAERCFKKGEILGFDVSVGDGDVKGVREGKLVWNGTPNGYKHSAVWGRLKLE